MQGLAPCFVPISNARSLDLGVETISGVAHGDHFAAGNVLALQAGVYAVEATKSAIEFHVRGSRFDNPHIANRHLTVNT